MKIKILMLVMVLVASATRPAWSDQAMDIIGDINRQLSVSYVSCEADMKIEGGRTYKLVLHMAVYPDGTEKTLVEVLKPRRKRATLLVVRNPDGGSTAHLKLPDGKIRWRSSELSDSFLRSLLIDADFKIREDVKNYSFQAGDRENELVATSKNPDKTFYTRRVIGVERMPDRSWIESAVALEKEGFIKTITNSGFVEIATSCWRPGKIVVEDKENKTVLILKNWKASQEIDERAFRLR